MFCFSGRHYAIFLAAGHLMKMIFKNQYHRKKHTTLGGRFFAM